MRRRGSLALRISLLSVAIAVITALVAGGIGIGLIRRSNASNAEQSLSRLADAAQADANLGSNAQAGQLRARALIRALKIQFAPVNKNGLVVGGDKLAQDAITAADITSLLDKGSVSATRTVDGVSVLLQGRPTNAGALVLVERRSDAVAVGEAAIRRLLDALAVAVAIAVVLGLLVAWRLARPLRRTAEAAHALATGRRDVIVMPEGPAEVAEVAEALNRLSAGLAHSEARQREFLMSVSHDLRTPLTAIRGYAESLADGVLTDAPRAGAVMLAETARLERLVADLLDLARLDAQEFRIDVADVDLVALVGAAAQVWSDRCAEAGIDFWLESPPYALVVRTDASRVRQILDGLFDNALRVTPAGAPIVLSLWGESVGGRPVAVAEVRDGGPGLADADLAVAFEKSLLYERYRGHRAVGTGLGLAIVAGLVARLGGTVEAGHAREGGARFTVRLPADTAPVQQPVPGTGAVPHS